MARLLPALIPWPSRCATICNGKAEVSRRTCWCKPWIIDDFRLDDLIHRLEEIASGPLPHGPIPRGPGPERSPVVPEPVFFSAMLGTHHRCAFTVYLSILAQK